MRIVLDTNILISALLTTNTPPDLLYQAWERNDFDLVTSYSQIDELERVLGYKHLQAVIPPASAQELLNTLWANAIILETYHSINVSPDPDDDAILATAITGQANLIVSGDKRHMITLRNVEGIPIVTAREALNYLEISG